MFREFVEEWEGFQEITFARVWHELEQGRAERDSVGRGGLIGIATRVMILTRRAISIIAFGGREIRVI